MATVEKLLVQIFEREKWIVNQAKQQAYLFEQHLASKCLIDGIAPPPWLLSSSSDPNYVLNQQELFTGVSLPPTLPAIPCTGSRWSVFDKPVPTAERCPVNCSASSGELPNGLSTEIHGFNKSFGAGDKVSVLPHCPISNAGCGSRGIPQDQREEDPSVTSPEDQRDARIPDIYHGPALSPARGAGDELPSLPQCPISNAGCASKGDTRDQREEDPSVTSPEDQRDARTSSIYQEPALSLARVQRSKSRQRAMAIRNTANKSRSPDRNNAGGTIGCAISSLQSDHVDKMYVVKPPDTCDNTRQVEEAKVGEFQSKERGNDISSGRITRSRSTGQQKSSSNIAGLNGGTVADSVCISHEQSDCVNQRLELVNDSCQEKEAKVRDHFSKGKGSSIYFGRTTRSRSATQQPNCLDELLKLENSANSVREDGVRNSMQQPEQVDETVEVVKSFDINDGSCEVKTKVAGCSSKGHVTNDYHGRITRLRSSSQLRNTVNNFSKLETSCVYVKGDDSTLKHSIGKSTQPLQPLSWTGGDPDFHDAHGPQVSILRSLPAQNNLEFCAVNGEKHSSKGNSSEEYVSRSTGSQAVRSIGKIAKDVSSNISHQIIIQLTSAASNKSHDARRTQISAGRSVPIQRDPDLYAQNSTDSSDKENVADQYAGGDTSAETNCNMEGISKPVSSQPLSHRGTQSRSSASNKHVTEKLNHRFAGIKHQDVSSTLVEEVPGAQNSEFVEASTVGETQVDPDGSVEANPICSESILDGTGLRVGVEVLVSRQPADCNVFVNPKQLNFDDVEEYCLNGISTSALKKGMQGRSSEKRSLSLMQAEAILDEGMTVNYQQSCNSPLDMNFLRDPEVSAKGKELHSGLSEAPAEELYKARSGSNGNVVSSVKETSDAHKDAVASTLLESGKVQKSSLIDYLTGLEVAQENSVESPVKEVKGSNLSNVNSAKSTELVSEESALDSHVIGNPVVSLSTDSDFAVVSEPGSFRIPDEKNLTVENPCAASTDETKGNLVQLIIHSQISSKYEPSTTDNRDVGYSKSTECQIAKKSKGRSFRSSMEGSWPQHKRRKTEKIVDGLSSSPGLREKTFHTVNRDTICGNLGSVGHSPKAILKSQGLSISTEDVVKSILSRSPAEKRHQNEDQHMIERSESSSMAEMKEGEISLGGGDRSADEPFTFMHEELETSVLSSLMKQAAGHSQDCLIEETGVAPPTSFIVNAGSPYREGNHVSLPLKDYLTLGSMEHLTSDGSTIQEKRFDLGGTSIFSYFSVGSPHGQSLDLIGADDTKPELEGFVLETDDAPTSMAGEDISFDEWNLPSTTIERASILEHFCKSACVQTPVACSSASYKLHKIPNLYQSVPPRVLDGVDMRTTLLMNDAVKQLKDSHSCLGEEVGQASYGRSYSEYLSSGQSGWDVKKPCISPVGKLWDRAGSSTSSSGKRGSLNQELPCISEENENTDEVVDTLQDGLVSEVLNSSIQRVPLADITEIPNPPASVSKAELIADRFSLDSVNIEFNLTDTHKSFKKKSVIQNSGKRRYNNKENQSISRGTNDIKRITEHNRFSKPKLSEKSSLGKGGPSLSGREPKRNNIVSSMTSFIPLVQQKQAAAVVTGKRDIKVKALEAAETAKRLAEKKEDERKMKKEALKLERLRMEQENKRQLELQKKKKEEETRKKEADMAAKKRRREEEDRKERERKRMRVEARRQQREQEDKLPAEKEEKEMKCQVANEGRGHGSTESKDETAHRKMEQERGYDTLGNITDTAPSTSRVSTSNARRESIVHDECCEALSSFAYNTEVLSNLDKAIENGNSVANTSQEQSYDISPYKESDDENEEDDDVIPNSKFIPSWARMEQTPGRSSPSKAFAASLKSTTNTRAFGQEEIFKDFL